MQPPVHTFNELTTTGNLTLIRDPDVRQRILEYYGSRSLAFQWDENT